MGPRRPSTKLNAYSCSLPTVGVYYFAHGCGKLSGPTRHRGNGRQHPRVVTYYYYDPMVCLSGNPRHDYGVWYCQRNTCTITVKPMPSVGPRRTLATIQRSFLTKSTYPTAPSWPEISLMCLRPIAWATAHLPKRRRRRKDESYFILSSSTFILLRASLDFSYEND